MTTRSEHEVDPFGVVPLRGLGREDAGARIGRPPGVGPIDQQRAHAGPAELVRGRRSDHPTTDHHDVERAHNGSCSHQRSPESPAAGERRRLRFPQIRGQLVG